MLNVQPHTDSQPGLRGHSHDPENDLLKRFVVMQGLNTKNWWMWVASFNTQREALHWLLEDDENSEKEYRIIDQFNDNKIIWSE